MQKWQRLIIGGGAALAMLASAPVARSQSCASYPNTLNNASVAEANQFMANFNYLSLKPFGSAITRFRCRLTNSRRKSWSQASTLRFCQARCYGSSARLTASYAAQLHDASWRVVDGSDVGREPGIFRSTGRGAANFFLEVHDFGAEFDDLGLLGLDFVLLLFNRSYEQGDEFGFLQDVGIA